MLLDGTVRSHQIVVFFENEIITEMKKLTKLGPFIKCRCCQGGRSPAWLPACVSLTFGLEPKNEVRLGQHLTETFFEQQTNLHLHQIIFFLTTKVDHFFSSQTLECLKLIKLFQINFGITIFFFYDQILFKSEPAIF